MDQTTDWTKPLIGIRGVAEDRAWLGFDEKGKPVELWPATEVVFKDLSTGYARSNSAALAHFIEPLTDFRLLSFDEIRAALFPHDCAHILDRFIEHQRASNWSRSAMFEVELARAREGRS